MTKPEFTNVGGLETEADVGPKQKFVANANPYIYIYILQIILLFIHENVC